MGQRHLFYHMGEGFIAFATERRGVEAIADTPRHLPMSEIIRVLHWGARGWRGVNTAAVDPILFLAGGTVATLGAGGAHETRRYWEPGADPRHLGRDEAYYIAAYREVLGEAVACRLRRATGSVGLFMSGGFDSAAISALAGPEVAAQGRKLIAAASVMPEAYQGDIRHAGPWVEICRRHMPHLDVRYVTREGLDVFHGMQQRFMATQGPHSGSRYTNDALFSALTAAGARIAMDGHGGDYTLNPSAQGFFIALLFQGRWGLFLSEWRARRRFLGTTHAMLFRTSILPHLAPRLIRAWRRHRNGLAPFGPSMPVAKAFLRETRALRRPERKLRPYALREPLKRTLDVLQNEEALGHAFNAAAHGLAYTQPFHDKRVIELALAIPETLYMRGGRERYLARVALGDLYPPQFQTRRPEGDDAAPDFLSMAKRIEPEVLKDIDRMERAGKLSAYFDFPRMRRMLTRRRFGQHASGYEVDTHQALLAFLWARYIEWFRGDN
jgi:asparagine synthase (glutamine-hydrolysing)